MRRRRLVLVRSIISPLVSERRTRSTPSGANLDFVGLPTSARQRLLFADGIARSRVRLAVAVDALLEGRTGRVALRPFGASGSDEKEVPVTTEGREPRSILDAAARLEKEIEEAEPGASE